MQLQLLLGNADHTIQPTQRPTLQRCLSLPAPATILTSKDTTSTATSTLHSAPSSSKHITNKPTAEVVDLVSDEDTGVLSKAPHSSKVSTLKRSTTYGSVDSSDIEVVELGPSKRRRNNRIIQDSESSGDEYLPNTSANSTTLRSSVRSEVKVVSRARSGSALDRAHNIQDNVDVHSVASSSVAAVVSKRDHSYSSLHSVGKLLNAKLGKLQRSHIIVCMRLACVLVRA